MIFVVPSLDECIDFAKKIGCSVLEEVRIEPRDHDLPLRCHDNCSYNPILGYYFFKEVTTGFLYAYKHSVLLIDTGLVDVTPVVDDRTYNMFGYGPDLKYDQESLVYLENCVFINKERHGEQDMYYVYGLIDPRTDLPFYIGKGKGSRWQQHYSDKELTENAKHKKTERIIELRDLGFEPKVIFYAQNIEDENLAYDIETSLISSYGRINYEPRGILTNITVDSRPPNWKGKTYEEIYGEKRGLELKKIKAEQQIARGGYFRGRKHREESKRRIGIKSAESALSEEYVMERGKEFCNFFNNKINRSKWKWWAKKNNVEPNILKHKSRFGGKYALEIFSERLGAVIENNSALLWYHHPMTKETYRIQDWELEYGAKIVPIGYVRGRGVYTFDKK